MNVARKTWLKQLASSSHGAWMTAVRPPALDGSTRVETRRTVYVFEDGQCVDVVRRDAAPPSAGPRDPFIGARLMGWVVEEQQISLTWSPGARAVLWRADASDDGQSMIALTSPAFAFVRMLSEDAFEDDEDDAPTSVLEKDDTRLSA